MAKTTTVQKIRDKWAILSGLDKDNIISDDAEAFLELVNIAVDEAWMATEWPFAMRVFPLATDANELVDLSSDTAISECLRAYNAHPYTTDTAKKFDKIRTVEDADTDGVYVIGAGTAVDAAVTSVTSSSTTATCTTTAVHGFSTGNYVIMAGADVTAYNGTFQITVTSTTVFTYTLASDPADTTTGTITATGATAYLVCKIVTPEYTLVADTPPRRLETYLAYKTSADWLRGEGQEDKANKRLMIAEQALLKEIDRVERQMNQATPLVVTSRIAGVK